MALYGIDISSWQTVDAALLGDDFTIVKATQGTNYVSKSCEAQYQRAKAAGKLLGVYHYAAGGDPTAEANFFVNNIKGYIGEAVLVLDWESGQNARFGEHASWCKVFLDRVKELTGVRPMIYMSASVVNSQNWSSISGEYGLWIAGYPNRFNVTNPAKPTVGDMPYGIGSWKFWAIWQYTSSAGTLDRNIAQMDRAAWLAYAGKNGSSAPAPAVENRPTPAPAVYGSTYTVQRGDNLSAIAAKFGTTYQAIAALNGIANPNLIFAGQVLKVPGGSPAPAPAAAQSYTVQSGDTLSGIAAKFGTSWKTLQSINGLPDANKIYPGQKLRVK